MTAIMRLVAYMRHSLLLFDDLQERIARHLPGDQLVVIARLCRQDRPVKPIKAVKLASTTPARPTKPTKLVEAPVVIETPGLATVEQVEIGLALVAFAGVLGLDLDPPSEVYVGQR